MNSALMPDVKLREIVWELSGGRCFWCGIQTVRERRRNKLVGHDEFTVDHHVPKALGGPNLIQNLVCACNQCNGLRGGDYQLYRNNPEYLRFKRLV